MENLQRGRREDNILHMYDATFICRTSGLLVRSGVSFAGALSQRDTGRNRPDVIVMRGDCPVSLDAPRHRGPCWAADDRHLLLDLPGIGRLLAADGERVTLDPAPGVPVDDMAAFAAGIGLSAILHQRGTGLVLQASAVLLDGRAHLFCGPPGSGKSTLAAALCQVGGGLVADDRCVIEAAEPVLVHPEGLGLQLRSDALSWLGLEDRSCTPVRGRGAKVVLGPPEHTPSTVPRPAAPVPVASIQVMADIPGDGMAMMTRLPALPAAQLLLNQIHARRLALAWPARVQPAGRIAAVLNHVPVYRLDRPRDLRRLGETVDLILAMSADMA